MSLLALFGVIYFVGVLNESRENDRLRAMYRDNARAALEWHLAKWRNA